MAENRRIVITILLFTLFIGNFSFLLAQEGKDIKANTIFTLLSESGKIIPDLETNSFTVVDYPANIAMVEEHLKMVDVPSEQVLIESRVVEVKLEKEHALGVNWSLFAQKGGAEIGQFRLRSLPTSTEELYGITPGLRQEIPFRKTKWEPGTGDEEEPFSIGIFDENINIVLKALTAELKTNILSAPKITTSNNRRAKIDVVKTIPYLKEVKEEKEEEEGGGETITITYTYDYTEEGVILEVTPQINPDRSITMVLCPQVKEIVRWHELWKPLYALKAPLLPETDIRMAQTKVNIKNGQTLVIGGLIREKLKDGTTKVPLLGDIPALGALFRSKKETKDKTELLIFVSPTIITPDEFVRMAREERYGIGRRYMEDREKQTQMVLAIEAEEKAKKDKLVAELEGLAQRQKALVEERKGLEKKITEEEKSLEELEETKKAVVEKRKELEKKESK